MIRNKTISTVTDDYSQHKQLIERFQMELVNLPYGSLQSKNCNGKVRYYHYTPSGSNGTPGKQVYINAKNEGIKTALARRKFIEMCIDSLMHNIEKLQPPLSGYVVYDPEEVRRRMPKAYEGIECSNPSDMMERENPSAWVNEPYEKSTLRLDALKHKSQNGILVRSKSEAMIASQLEYNNIPYRYEQRFDMPDHFFYPDFTILNPEDNQIMYWEHFGLMDDEDYRMSVVSKLDAYQSAGILQWENLITTYETSRRPLDAHKVRRIIKAFLLPETP
ncbi:MAG: hypothetical protein WC977_10660 [Anaerovoracaceae bacterium]